MPDHPAIITKDQLVNDLSAAKASKPSTQTKDNIKRDIGKYYDELIKGAVGWKVKILEDERKRALKIFDAEEVPGGEETDKEEKRKGKIDEGIITVENSLGWVVPRPVDPDVIAAVIARDRAAAEAVGHPVGTLKKVG